MSFSSSIVFVDESYVTSLSLSTKSPFLLRSILIMEQMLKSPWLESLLTTQFFIICSTHKDSPRSECNMYCLDCQNGAFCFYCRSSKHKDHLVIQIRRSSYHDVVRVSEIQKVMDIGEVQTYVINSARVLFLNERPQPKSNGKGVSHLCQTCGRSLLDPFSFCSLGCKLVGIKKNGDPSFILRTKNEQIGERREGMSRRTLVGSKQEEESLVEANQQQEIFTSTHSLPKSNSRRRKGIPHRAPLRS